MADTSILGKPGVIAGKLPPLVKRFYPQFALLLALVVMFIAGIARIWSLSWFSNEILALVILAFFVTIACRLFAESRDWNNARFLALSAGAIALLAVPLFLGNTIKFSWDYPGLPLLCASVALLVLTAPFLRRDHTNEALWEYNRATGAGVISGLAITLLVGTGFWVAVKMLSSMQIPGPFTVFPYLACMSFVAVWQLLAGLPRRFDATPADPAPKWLSKLANLVIAPLLAAGFAILLVLLILIIAPAEPPKIGLGWIAAGFAIFVVAAHFVSWPLRDSGGRAVRLFHGHYRYALLAPLIVLALDMGLSIADSGLTEGDYLLPVLAVWLCATTIYHWSPTRRRLVVAPAMLAALLFAASVAPWGVIGLSTRIHLAQLEKQLTTYELLVEGTVVPADAFIETKHMKSITATLKLFKGEDARHTLGAWFADHGLELEDGTGTHAVMSSMGLQYISRWGDVPSFRFYGSRAVLLDVENFSYKGDTEWRHSGTREINEFVAVNGTKFETRLNRDEGTLVVRGGGDERVVFDLNALVQRLKQGSRLWYNDSSGSDLENSPITLEATSESGRLTVRLHIYSIEGDLVDGAPEVQSVDTTILLRERRTP